MGEDSGDMTNGDADGKQPRPRVPLDDVLVEDRELDKDQPDKFGHSDIVEQIVDLVTSVKTPANVALYGPWGSGKSSLANHLDKSLEGHAKAKFVRYDAFKFARLPLQRNFIRHLATQLSVADNKFHDGLYQDEDSDDLTFDQPQQATKDTSTAGKLKKWWHEPKVRTGRKLIGLLLVVFTIGLVLAMAFTAVAAFIGSAISEKDSFATTFADYMKLHLLGFLAPAGLLALFGAVVTQKLTVTRHRHAPTSEDELAERFRDLVTAGLAKNGLRDKPRERLVVFIDELDRCDGPTVVETLESLRTFLDSPNCVIVVAADQQVLETALTEHLQQATPVDVANPYYSAGSEYLDKTFHYQLSLPPLLSRRLSTYAAGLVEEKQGAWAEVPVGRVVSVLIPNHIRSPRRAKTLLNAYALSYELAAKRIDDNQLAGPILDRAEELAVLTCLRVEFPLFARELVRYPRLVRACRAVIRNAPGDEFDKDTWGRAQEFMSGKRASATVLVDEPDSAHNIEQAAAIASAVAAAVVAATAAGVATVPNDAAPAATTETDDEAAAPPDDPAAQLVDAVADNDAQQLRNAQSTLLRRYLQKTASVPGPTRDLIHLEGAGAHHGLDPVDAEQLEDLATQGDRDQTWELVARLDLNGQIGSLRSLADALRDDTSLGIEADNLASALLWLYSRVRDDHSTVPAFIDASAYVAAAVSGHLDNFTLQPHDLQGAFCLGLDLDNPAGRRLVNEVLDNPAAGREAELVARVLDASPGLPSGRRSRVLDLLTSALTDNAMRPIVGERLTRLDTDDACELVDAVLDDVATQFHDRIEANEADEALDEAEKKAAEGDLIRSLAALCPSSPRLHRRAATIVLRLDTQDARTQVLDNLADYAEDTGKITYKPLVIELLRALGRRDDEALLRVFEGLDMTLLTADERKHYASRLTADRWHGLTRQLYVEWTDLQPALRAIGTLADARLGPETGAATVPVNAIKVPSTGDEAVEEINVLHGLRVYLIPGTVDPTPSIDQVVTALSGVLTAVFVAPEPAAGLPEWVTAAGKLIAEFGTTEQAQAAIDLIGESTWVAEPTVAALRLYLTARERDLTPVSPVTIDSLIALSPQTDESIHELASRWLPVAAPAPADGARLIAVLHGHMTTALLDAIRAYIGTLTESDRIELIRAELRTFLDGPVIGELLDALGLADLPDTDAAQVIIDVFDDVGNMDQRKRFLEAWERARITDPAARERLIREVLIPIGKSGVGGVDHLTKHQTLCHRPPAAVHDDILRFRRDLDEPSQRRLRDPFVTAGLIEKRGKRLLRGGGHEYIERWLGTPPTAPIVESDSESSDTGDPSPVAPGDTDDGKGHDVPDGASLEPAVEGDEKADSADDDS
ncbi:MAG: P-loop NTPase fold protein [Acidimicrobiales bacterium]|nr:P-loop NTPase fold protein [Acidimicrobiales bacterium]